MAKEDKKKNVSEEMEMDWDSGLSVEEEAAAINLPPVGEYNFEVVEFEKTYSKSNKPMAKVNLKLDCDGQSFRVYDYLVLTSNMAWKLATFFESLGLKEKGKDLARMPWEKVLGAHGRVKIKHELYNDEPRVKVDKYVVGIAATAKKKPDDDGDMPFEL